MWKIFIEEIDNMNLVWLTTLCMVNHVNQSSCKLYSEIHKDCSDFKNISLFRKHIGTFSLLQSQQEK